MNKPKNAYYYCSRRTGAGDCKASGMPESRLREAVIDPLADLLGRLRGETKTRTMIREQLRLYQAAMDAKNDSQRTDLEAARDRLSAKLTRIEDLYLDGTWPKDRYLERREGIQTQLEAIKAELAALPQVVRTNVDELFTIADSLDGTPPDDQEWREIVTEMVERVVIKRRAIEVVWRDPVRNLIARD